MFKKILKLGAVIAVSLTFLSACKDQPRLGITEEIHQGQGKGFLAQCIAADDFGFPKTPVIPARPEADDILGEREDQTSYWLDTGFISDGDDLLVQASGTWTSWFSGNFEAPISAAQDEKYCVLDWDLNPGNIFTCEITGMPIYNGGTHENRAIYMNVNSPDFNAPCWFTSGYSGYLLFMPQALGPVAAPNYPDSSGVGDPVAMKYPTHPTMHLFGWNDRNCTSFFNANPDPAARNYSGEYCGGDYELGDIVFSEMYQPLPREDGAQRGDRLWVRIADRYYDDNKGFYVFTFKRGARTPGIGPIEAIITFVSDRIFGADGRSGLARQLYEEVIADPTFQRVVLISLMLYIILTGYTFIIRGRMSQGEFVARALKFGVILALIQPGSWDFFYEYLFNIFIEGTYDLIDIVINAAVGTPSGPSTELSGEYITATIGADEAARGDRYNLGSRGPQYFDDLIDIFFSPETLAKIHAALFYGGGIGVFVLAAFYFALGVFLFIMIRIVIVYLLGIIPIGILIIIAPLFILFLLFDFTRKYFQNWLSQLVSAALQLFMASAMLALISAVMLDYLQQTAGYRVCWKCWWCPRIDFGWVKTFGDIWAFFTGITPNPDPDAYLIWFLDGSRGSEPNGFKFWLPDIRYDASLYQVDEAGYRANQRYYDEYYPGYMGYIYLDWDRDGVLEVNFRNPLDLPFYDPADVSPNSQRGREALNYKLNGNLLTVPDVLVFILVLLVFLIFSQQVTAIAKGLADDFFGINYGDAAGHMLRTGRQIGASFLSKFSSSAGSATSGARRAIGTRVKGAAGGAGAALFDWGEGLSQSTADLRDEYEQLRRDELNAIKRETAADLDQAALMRRERGKALATEMEGNRVNRDQYEARRQEELRAVKRGNINEMESAMQRHQRRGKILSDEMNQNLRDGLDDMAAAQREGEGIRRVGEYEKESAAYLRELRGERLASEMKDNKFNLDNDVMRNQNNLDKIAREGQFEQDMAQARREYRGVRLAS
ncbi:MAG: type IV secretion system protein, partial [Rickettsiales bacterium]|nr:type IV secretion system protein [Rickettsiales bacterium]